SQNLRAGTYYLQVNGGGTGTTYKLDASAVSLGAFPVDNAGQNIDTAKDLGVLTSTVLSSIDYVGDFNGLASDIRDYYKFTLTENSTVNLKLSELSQDASLQLFSNTGTNLNNSFQPGNTDENISQNLRASTYYLQVNGGGTGTTYKLDAS
ncbi:MAG: PPC domain-containing protein, partial [Aphanizomenon gracile PMC649.10]|nr:PPC domain-containing protein [Aphanizomenon gracile PMC649.10]